MYFTQEDYRKIEEWLRARTVRDTQFPDADNLTGVEKIPLIQDGKNKTVSLNSFLRQISLMELPDFLNVTAFADKEYLTLDEAILLIPIEQRKLGLTITFCGEKGNWMIYQFNGASLNQWTCINCWSSIVEEALAEFVYYPDDEDIEGVDKGDRTFLKFKDKGYDPDEFSGMGRIIIRKNITGTRACSLDDKDHYTNVLTQNMMRQENTVYIIQYDFDLDGKVISVPKGCTLWFQGGSINNGSMYLHDTAILGAFEFADIGDVKLFGEFNKGQVMTFSDDSYKAKTGGYFVASTKSSSASSEEDAKQEAEVFYDRNANAYTTKTRQELRWWNGEEWLLLLDITDYNELKSILSDLVDKHNAEMSACYKYFKARCYSLEQRMSSSENRLDGHDTTINNHDTRISNNETRINNANSNIGNIINDVQNIRSDIESLYRNGVILSTSVDNISQSVNALQTAINNLDQIIENQIIHYIDTNIIGVASVKVNGTVYRPNSSGVVELPNYPGPDGGIADSTKGKLTVKSSNGSTLVSFNGDSDKTLILPEAGGSEGGDTNIITAKEPLTIKHGNTTLGTYTGEEAKTVTIPVDGGTADKVAHKMKFTGASTAEYDGSSEVSVKIPTLNDLDTKALTIKNASGAEVASYNAKTTKEVQLKKLRVKANPRDLEELQAAADDRYKSKDIDLLDAQGTVDISLANYGSAEHPIVLYSANIHRMGNDPKSTVWEHSDVNRHPLITTEIKFEGEAAVVIKLNHPDACDYIHVSSAVATFSTSKARTTTATTWGKYRGEVIGLRCGFGSTKLNDGQWQRRIYVQGIRTNNENNDSIDFDPVKSDGTLIGFNIIITGYIDR